MLHLLLSLLLQLGILLGGKDAKPGNGNGSNGTKPTTTTSGTTTTDANGSTNTTFSTGTGDTSIGVEVTVPTDPTNGIGGSGWDDRN